MAETRRFAGITSRSQLKALNNLGVITRPLAKTAKQFRKMELETYDSYYEGRQYAGMPMWTDSTAADGSYIPVKARAPMLQLNFAKILTSRLASKLVGRRNFPELKVEEDPDTTELLGLVVRQGKLRSKLLEAIRRTLVSGSGLVRFSIMDGQYRVEHYLSKWCFPILDNVGGLQSVKIQYVFDDENDKNPETQQPKKKWFRMDLGKERDVLYDNPEFKSDEEPVFQVVQSVQHNLGFVQAEWFRTAELPNTIDGVSIIGDILGFIDELNYNFSQSSQAISYNQDPQLTFTNMDEDEVSALIRSSVKGWNLGKEGQAQFLEGAMTGVEAASEFRDRIRLNVQDIARVILMDPEKVVGHAQSGRSMEVLHGPMVELIEELQPMIESPLKSLVLKMMLVTVLLSRRGVPAPVTVPPNYAPKSLDITSSWPDIFPKTMEDLQKKVGVASTVSGANLISRETLTRWLAKDFGVENIEEELQKISSQPILNPFGAF